METEKYNKVLFIDEEKAQLEWQQVQKATEHAKKMYDSIASTGIIPNKSEIESAFRGTFYSLFDRFKENELMKVKPFIDQYGDTPLTDGLNEKIEILAKDYKTKLIEIRKLIHIHALDWFDYIEVENGVKIKNDINIDYFRKKYTVSLTKPEHFQFYNKHAECCKLLNELTEHPENEFEVYDRLFKFNPDTKEFELNIETYYPDVYNQSDVRLIPD